MKHFTWITDLHVNLRNAWLFARGGRARWRIENETFNTLKNQGYHFEHNFGHGQQNLSVVFAMLMMLAFLVDQAQQLCCPLFRAVWEKLGSKRALWDNLRSHFRHFRIRVDAATLRSHSVRSWQRGAASWAGQLLTLLLRSRQRPHTWCEAIPRPTFNVFQGRFPAHDRPRRGKTPLSPPAHVILRPAHTRQVSSASTEIGTDCQPPCAMGRKYLQSAPTPGIAVCQASTFRKVIVAWKEETSTQGFAENVGGRICTSLLRFRIVLQRDGDSQFSRHTGLFWLNGTMSRTDRV